MLRKILIRISAAIALIALTITAYLLLARPYQLRWGATAEELSRPMSGDELDPRPTFLSTRAITIEGTPHEIWPWLVQMGYNRAGYYGYDIIENLGSKNGIHSAEKIVPALQDVKVGDEVPISAAGSWVFYEIEPERYFIWSSKASDCAFTWALYPIDKQHTRLVSRIRWSHHWTQPDILGFDLFTEFTDYLAIRKVLQGVKGRVEGYIEPMAWTNTEFAFYVAGSLIFTAAVVLLIVRPLTWGRWMAGLAAGITWLITWYAPISIWTGSGLLICAVYWLWQMHKSRPMEPIKKRESQLST
jgi:hypothetical protein